MQYTDKSTLTMKKVGCWLHDMKLTLRSPVRSNTAVLQGLRVQNCIRAKASGQKETSLQAYTCMNFIHGLEVTQWANEVRRLIQDTAAV